MTTNKTPRVSVIMPTYNDAHFLPKALENIFEQTWTDFELIVVNDGSTDDTRAILDDYATRYPITPIRQPNQKLPAALNTGFQQARGDYLTWTSTDNFMMPNMLATLVGALDDHPQIGLVYADWEVIDDDGQVLGAVSSVDYDPHLLMRFNFVQACFMYRRDCQDRVGLYDPDFFLAEDWEYWWRILKEFELLRVPQVLYQYRVHKGSLTHFIKTQQDGVSSDYKKLAERCRANPLDWYWSKVKYELLNCTMPLGKYWCINDKWLTVSA